MTLLACLLITGAVWTIGAAARDPWLACMVGVLLVLGTVVTG